jgi:hypothetical protein
MRVPRAIITSVFDASNPPLRPLRRILREAGSEVVRHARKLPPSWQRFVKSKRFTRSLWQVGTSISGSGTMAAQTVNASTTTNYQFKATGANSYVQISNTSTTAATVTAVSVQSAGALPTNWAIQQNVGGASVVPGVILMKVIGTGTESGINYVDIQFSGTAASITATSIAFDATNGISASVGQT